GAIAAPHIGARLMRNRYQDYWKDQNRQARREQLHGNMRITEFTYLKEGKAGLREDTLRPLI
ncbi:MAG: hypothetical protein WA854_00750, partial [Candidatus Binataceae bacterium]